MRWGPVLWFAGLLAAQGPLAGQDLCRVEGTVLNSATGQPVPRAVVSLQAVGGFQRIPGQLSAAAASSNSEGKFAFTNVAPGKYQISAQRDNFQYIMPRQYEPMTLNAGEQKSGVVVQLTPLGAIAGRVQNEEGDALQNVQVSVMVYQYAPGGRQLVNQNAAATNDLGEYRIFGLRSGKYFVRAAMMGRTTNGTDETYIPLYYPGAADPSGAAAVELAAGQDMRGVDFTLRRVHGVTVRGHAAKPAGAATGGMSVSLMAAAGGGGIGAVSSLYDREGNFEIRGVAPGSYTLTARTSVENKMYVAERPLTVGGEDIDGIELILAPPADVSGVLRIEGDTTAKISQIQVMFQGPRQTNPGKVNDDGTVEVRNLAPGVYRVNASWPGLFLKSVRCGTTDVTETGVDLTGGAGCELSVTLSANGGQIDGQVQDESGNPAAGAQVTLVAQGTRREDQFKQTGTDANGHFRFAAVAPGNYRLYAWEEVDVNAIRYDPDYIKPFESQGQSVQISEGDKQTVTLKQIPKPTEGQPGNP